jgi:hypothetical protein
VSDPQLFDATPFEVPTEPTPDPYQGLGQDARRTARRRELLAQGIHPITKRPTRPEFGTCGDCAHLLVKDIRPDRRWFKCELTLTGGSPAYYGTGPDVRKSYPACSAFQPAAGGDA